MSELIQKTIDQTERDKYGVCCAEAVHALDVANDRIAELKAELVDFKDSHADEWMKRKELEEDVAFYKARLDAVMRWYAKRGHWSELNRILYPPKALEQKDGRD